MEPHPSLQIAEQQHIRKNNNPQIGNYNSRFKDDSFYPLPQPIIKREEPAQMVTTSSFDEPTSVESPKQNKRRKISPSPKPVKNDVDSVTLSREELLSFSSEQYESFVEQICQVRELSQSEKNEIKRQRRLIKNRESAQASRQRKKSLIDDLEKKVRDLGNENHLLKRKVSTLDKENSYLKRELAQLQSQNMR